MSESDGPRFHCPACKKSYKWKPELAGKKAKCKCGAVMAVPSKAPVAAKAPAPAKPKPAAVEEDPFADPFADLESAAQSEAAAPTAAVATRPATAGATTECPSCGAALSKGAKLCVECGYNLATGEQVTFGFKNFDALHVATAEISGAAIFATCDLRLLAAARRNKDRLHVRVLSILELAQEVLK